MNLDVGCGVNPHGDVNCDIRQLHGIKNFVRCDANNLPFQAKVFRNVSAFNVLEHVENPNATMNELHYVGRNVIVSVDSFLNPLNWIHPNHTWLTFQSFGNIYFLRRPRLLKLVTKWLYHAIYGNQATYRESTTDRVWRIEPWLKKQHITWSE